MSKIRSRVKKPAPATLVVAYVIQCCAEADVPGSFSDLSAADMCQLRWLSVWNGSLLRYDLIRSINPD